MYRQKCYYATLLKSHWHTIFMTRSAWKIVCQCVFSSRCNAISIIPLPRLSFLLIWVIEVIQQTGFYTCPYPCKLHYSHTPSTTHSHSITSASKEAISTAFANFPIWLFFSLFFLNSNEKVVEASSVLYFWEHHTPIQTHRSTGHCTFTFIISKPCAKAWGLQNPGPWRFITTLTLGEMPIPTVKIHKSQHLHCWLDS